MRRKRSVLNSGSKDDDDYVPSKRRRGRKPKKTISSETPSKTLMKYFNDTLPEKEVRSLLPPELAKEYLMFVRQCSDGKDGNEENLEEEMLSGNGSESKQTNQNKNLSTEHIQNISMDEADIEGNEQSCKKKKKKKRDRKNLTKSILNCLLCNKICKSLSEKQAHYSDHLSERGYECTYCPKAFDKMPALVSHVSRIHLINKGLSCKVCGQVFRRECLLRNHSLIHSSRRKFSCPVCKRGFIRKRDLFDHISGHINYNPYKCDECGKRFQLRCYLSLHRKIHVVVRPFKCEFCDSHCVNYSDIKMHTLLHTQTAKLGVDCSECEVRIHKYRYAQHVLTHSRKKNLKCTLCPAKFYAETTLKDHMKAHQSIKEYKCNVCEKVMLTISECSNHICPKWTDEICKMYIKKGDDKRHKKQNAPQPKCNEEALELNFQGLDEDNEEVCDGRNSPNTPPNISCTNQDSGSQSENDDSYMSDDSSFLSDDYDQNPILQHSKSSQSVLINCSEPLNLDNGPLYPIEGEEEDSDSD